MSTSRSWPEKEPEKADEEGKVWRIKIRENAKWENGDAIDVDDVIYSFKMCLDLLWSTAVPPACQRLYHYYQSIGLFSPGERRNCCLGGRRN